MKLSRRELIKKGSLATFAFALPIPLSAFKQFNVMKDSKNNDVIIIGGSYAGLSAAMALGRSLKNVLIIDSGNPCNKQTPHSHNFITQDDVEPAIISQAAKEQVLNYPTVTFLSDVAMSGKKTANGFEITTQSGVYVTGKKLILATGVRDIMPGIKGFAECWGISVIHCPYCHGYEFKGKKTAIMANGERAMHLAMLIHNLTDQLTILTSGIPDFNEEQLAKLNQHEIKVIETSVSEIEHENGQVKNIIFNDGKKLNVDAVYAAIPFRQHSEIPVELGCELTEQGHIKTDAFQKTTVAGVYACGDNTSPMRSVSNAVAAGGLTGAMVNMELTKERF